MVLESLHKHSVFVCVLGHGAPQVCVTLFKLVWLAWSKKGGGGGAGEFDNMACKLV